jgi:phosphopantetheinyl transferase
MDSIHSIRKEIALQEGVLIYWHCSNYEARVKSGGKKAMEKLEITKMLQTIGFEDFPLKHKENGQPYLEGSLKHFSISHSKGWFALALSKNSIGIDIEPIRTSIEKGTSYFLNEVEIKQPFTVKELHIIWGAKEAIFKQLNGAISNLKKEVSVIEINAKNILLDYQQQTYRFEYLFIQEVCLVWSI